MNSAAALTMALVSAITFYVGIEYEKLQQMVRRRRVLLGRQRRLRDARGKRADFRRHMELLAQQAQEALHLTVTSAPVRRDLKLLAHEPGKHLLRVTHILQIALVMPAGHVSVQIGASSRAAMGSIVELLSCGEPREVIVAPEPQAHSGPFVFLETPIEGGHDAAGS